MTLCVVALLSQCALALAQSVRVHVCNADTTGNLIPKEIYGQFSEHLGRCIYDGIWVGPESDIPNIGGYRTDVLEALKAIRVPVLRWPGGCFADDYHWMDGIGPRESRTLISNNNWGGTMEDNSFGTHEFLDYCELLGCQPYISGNVGSGTASELAKWVEYITSDSGSTVAQMRRSNGREKPWDLKYLGIGNEAWGCGGNMRPEYYSDLFRRYTTYTRDYNRAHGLYKVASGGSGDDYNWTEVCMREIGTRMNAIAVHYYTVLSWSNKGAATSFSRDDYYRTLSCALDIESILLKHMEIMDKYDPEGRVDLFVDEWGTWWDVEPGTNPGHLFQQNTMRDALVAALSFNVFHKYTSRIKMCNIAQVVNVLQSMVLTRGDQMVLTPTYHVFDMYKCHQDARFVPVEYDAQQIPGTGGRAVPNLSVTASGRDGSVWVSLVNPSLDKECRVDLSWDDFASYTVAGARVLAAENITDYNDFEGDGAQAGASCRVSPRSFMPARKMGGSGVMLRLPAASVVTLELKAL